MKKILTALFGTLGFMTACTDKAPTPIEKISMPMPANETLESFGYKMTWYVVSIDELTRKNLTLQDIANYLKLTKQENLSWNDGILKYYAHYGENTVFITPNLNGYVYIICPVNEHLDLLDKFVDNYFAFTSYRVVDAVAWKVVQNGEIIRYFQYADGVSEYNIGQPLLAEKELNLPNIHGLNAEQTVEMIFDELEKNQDNFDYLAIFDEDMPLLINEQLTGQNPSKVGELSIHHVQALGIFGKLPK